MYEVEKRLISTVEDADNVCGRIKRLHEDVADFSNVDHVTSSAAKKIIEWCDEESIVLKNVNRDVMKTFNDISEGFEERYQNNE